MDLQNALWWLFLNFLTLIALGFYSMQEMACVSFNKIRLQYYVSKGMKRAIWLNYMLQNPSRLFGTTLISVNAAMFTGSECAREFYLSLGLSPDLAPITQVIIVIIFAELAPMFAARRYAEHVALMGAPILYATAKILTPFLWSISWISKVVDFLSGSGSAHHQVVLNQEELQKILDNIDEDLPSESEGEDVNAIARNIFSLRNKEAIHVMQPLSSIAMLPANATVDHLKKLLIKSEQNYVTIYQKAITHIVGIANPRDFIRIPETRRVRDYAFQPWFITQHTNVIQILKEFRRNSKNVAVVLNEHGLAIGIITLEDLVEEVFGRMEDKQPIKRPLLIIDRTFPGDMTVEEFNKQFAVVLDEDGELTLAELMTKTLGHQPEEGESLYIFPFELRVKETSLTEVKKITITTRKA
jgi:putative hemolysin